MIYERLIRPRYVNPNTITCEGVRKDGSTQQLDFTVPEDEESGVNEYFDFIVENYSLKDIKAQYEVALRKHRAMQQEESDRKKRDEENERLKRLFNQKSNLFEMPFIKEGSTEVRSAIRRAPDEQILQVIAVDSFRRYLDDKNMKYSDYLNYVDELTYGETDE